MSNFDMDFNQAVRKESRIGAREREKQKQEQERKEKHARHIKNNSTKPKPKELNKAGGSSTKPTDANQTSEQPTHTELEHDHERDDVRDSVRASTSNSGSTSTESKHKPKISNMQVDVNQFKEVQNLFTYVGGSKNIVLDDDYKKVQVTGLPDALIQHHQARLREQYTGRLITFPWGDYEISDANKVFTARTSYMRYNLFSGLRDTDATHVVLAKQWLVSHHGMIYSEHYDLAMSYQVHNDELDIYALIYAQYLDELEYYGVKQPKGLNGQNPQENMSEMMDTLYIGLSSLRKMLQDQQKHLEVHTGQTNVVQTILLLDRLGLLGGGLPNDMKDFMRVLELNRDKISEANSSMNQHIEAEKERSERILRDRRVRNK